MEFGWILLEMYIDDKTRKPNGALIQVDNGDTQYLTIKEYYNFIDNNKNKKKK